MKFRLYFSFLILFFLTQAIEFHFKLNIFKKKKSIQEGARTRNERKTSTKGTEEELRANLPTLGSCRVGAALHSVVLSDLLRYVSLCEVDSPSLPFVDPHEWLQRDNQHTAKFMSWLRVWEHRQTPQWIQAVWGQGQRKARLGAKCPGVMILRGSSPGFKSSFWVSYSSLINGNYRDN